MTSLYLSAYVFFSIFVAIELLQLLINNTLFMGGDFNTVLCNLELLVLLLLFFLYQTSKRCKLNYY